MTVSKSPHPALSPLGENQDERGLLLHYSTISSFIDNSLSCVEATRDGASVMTQMAFCVLGKAITSRIDVAPVKIAVSRSRPKARPPWGGAPNSRASSRNPNFFRASSSAMFSSPNIWDCTPDRWMRMLPPPISDPFKTKS